MLVLSPLSLFTCSILENFFCPTGYLDPLHQWKRRDYWRPHSHKDWPRLPLHRLQCWLRWQGFSSYKGKMVLVCMGGEVVTLIDLSVCVCVCALSLGQAGRVQSCRLWCWSGVPWRCSTNCSARYIPPPAFSFLYPSCRHLIFHHVSFLGPFFVRFC